MDNDHIKSSVYFAAANAAEQALPAESKALIDNHDKLLAIWGAAAWQGDVPDDLRAAQKAVAADQLANFAMECRRTGNEEFNKEWKVLNP